MGKQKTKINVKERIEDDTIDLSLSEISEIPVKDIAMYKRCTILDLSSNKIGALGKNFTTLNHLTKLDLSKNAIKILPEDFGKFINLRHLDLYDNHLEYLPLSFGTLKKLRYLDLKGNPLMPTLAKFVGPCITTKDCQQSAINTVKFLTEIQIRVNEERKVAAALKQRQEQEDLLKTENRDNENIIEQSEEVKVEDPSTIKPKKVKKKKLDKNNEDYTNKNDQQLSKNKIENIKRTNNNDYASIKNLFKFFIFTILFMFSILLFFTIFIIKFPVYTDVMVKKLPTNYQTIFVDVMQQFKKKVAHLIKLN